MLIGVMAIPSYFDGVLRFFKNFILFLTFPIRWILKNLFKALKVPLVWLSNKWIENTSKRKNDEDEGEAITVSAKFAHLITDSDSDDGDDGDDDGNDITTGNNLIRLSLEEESKSRQRGEAFGGDSIWQWFSLGTNPDFPFYKSNSENNIVSVLSSTKSSSKSKK